MPWFYFSGHVVRAVPVSRNGSVAVRPNTKVEILEVTPESQALINQGTLRRTSPPRGAKSIADQPMPTTLRVEDVVPKSALALNFAEKGVTTSKDLPPKKLVGKPEYTIHEMEMQAKARTNAPAPAADPGGDAGSAAALPADTGERSFGKKARRR